jgi:Putative quorum-sensing-regulated virulence factor
MPFGKYRGYALEHLPDDYLFWLYGLPDLREPLHTYVNLEYRRRCEPPPVPIGFDATTQELIEVGYKALAKKFHPDLGGSTEKMQQLNATMERLRIR